MNQSITILHEQWWGSEYPGQSMSLWILEDFQCPRGDVLLGPLCSEQSQDMHHREKAGRGCSLSSQCDGCPGCSWEVVQGSLMGGTRSTVDSSHQLRPRASCVWAGGFLTIPASVYILHRGRPYTRGFSASGATSSAQTSFFFFPEQGPQCQAETPARIRSSKTGSTTSSTSL